MCQKKNDSGIENVCGRTIMKILISTLGNAAKAGLRRKKYLLSIMKGQSFVN